MAVVLLCVMPAAAQTVKLGTWNLGWLTARPAGDRALPSNVVPRSDADIDRLRHYAAVLDADVVAFQGVDGPGIAARVFPPDRYALHLTADPILLRAGFAVRKGVDFAANPDLIALAPGPRPGLRSGADITLRAHGAALRLLSVDLKAGCRDGRLDAPDAPACAILQAQLRVLHDWMAARGQEGVAFAVLGDLNRWMQRADSVFAALQPASVPVLLATDGRASPCWGGQRFLDHVLAGGAAASWLHPDSLRVLVYRETDHDWRARLSDHCPVSVLLNIPVSETPP